MIDNLTSPQSDDTTTSEPWNKLTALKEDVEYTFANAIRRHQRGDPIDHEEVLKQALALLEKACPADIPQISEQSLRELMEGYWTHIKARKNCAPTGFRALNDALGGGLEAQRLVVLLGAPGAGKTALANQIADHAADAGRPVLYVTSEDTPFTLLAKTIARIGDVDYTAVLKGWETHQAKINAALASQAERQSSDRLHYLDATNGITLAAIRSRAQEHFARYANAGQGILVIDYLQRLARSQRDVLGANRDLRELVTVLTEHLRGIACELDCCVVALASQNRASGYGANGASALASAKESGDIEYSADVIMALSKEDESRPGARKAGTAFIKPWILRIDKNRQGATVEKLELDWQGDRQRFTEAIR